MRKIFTFFFALSTLTGFAQSRMKSVEELIDVKDTGWNLLNEWIETAKNKVEMLPVDIDNAKDALYKIQVSTKSSMGAVVYSTGGILIDNGWVRILGSGNAKLNRSLPDWNKGKAFKEFGDRAPFLLIADDAVGGFFILNGGALGSDMGKVYYLAPDSLEYEPLDLSYSDFLNFCFNGDLEQFYKNIIWRTWKTDVIGLHGDQVYNFYPYLWTKEGKI